MAVGAVGFGWLGPAGMLLRVKWDLGSFTWICFLYKLCKRASELIHVFVKLPFLVSSC